MRIKLKQLLGIVARHFDLDPLDLYAGDRQRHLTYARHIAVYLWRRESGRGFKVLRDDFEFVDHTSALHACHKIEKMILAGDAALMDDLADIEWRIEAIKAKDTT